MYRQIPPIPKAGLAQAKIEQVPGHLVNKGH